MGQRLKRGERLIRPSKLLCTECKEIKPIKCFEYGRHQCRKCRNGFRETKWATKIRQTRKAAPWRKKILRNASLRRHGITAAEYDRLLIAQKNRCKICRSEKSSANRLLSIDHDHLTGKIRGLLCNNCNTALGLFQDSAKLLRVAIRYLNA